MYHIHNNKTKLLINFINIYKVNKLKLKKIGQEHQYINFYNLQYMIIKRQLIKLKIIHNIKNTYIPLILMI